MRGDFPHRPVIAIVIEKNKVMYKGCKRGAAMEMKTIRQVAEEQGISYEAVRRQVAKYKKELKGHISTKGQAKYLDEYAVQFIVNRRRESPVVVLQQDTNAELEETKAELDAVKAELETMKNMMIGMQNKVIELQEENMKMIEASSKYENLLEVSQKNEQKVVDLEETLQETTEKLHAAEAEANSFQKSFFGLYRKVK